MDDGGMTFRNIVDGTTKAERHYYSEELSHLPMKAIGDPFVEQARMEVNATVGVNSK